jgi:hypothetical protein
MTFYLNDLNWQSVQIGKLSVPPSASVYIRCRLNYPLFYGIYLALLPVSIGPAKTPIAMVI